MKDLQIVCHSKRLEDIFSDASIDISFNIGKLSKKPATLFK